jgi:hypothetical protein
MELHSDERRLAAFVAGALEARTEADVVRAMEAGGRFVARLLLPSTSAVGVPLLAQLMAAGCEADPAAGARAVLSALQSSGADVEALVARRVLAASAPPSRATAAAWFATAVLARAPAAARALLAESSAWAALHVRTEEPQDSWDAAVAAAVHSSLESSDGAVRWEDGGPLDGALPPLHALALRAAWLRAAERMPPLPGDVAAAAAGAIAAALAAKTHDVGFRMRALDAAAALLAAAAASPAARPRSLEARIPALVADVAAAELSLALERELLLHGTQAPVPSCGDVAAQCGEALEALLALLAAEDVRADVVCGAEEILSVRRSVHHAARSAAEFLVECQSPTPTAAAAVRVLCRVLAEDPDALAGAAHVRPALLRAAAERALGGPDAAVALAPWILVLDEFG